MISLRPTLLYYYLGLGSGIHWLFTSQFLGRGTVTCAIHLGLIDHPLALGSLYWFHHHLLPSFILCFVTFLTELKRSPEDITGMSCFVGHLL